MAKGRPWCRLWATWATDPDVQAMSEVMQRRLVMAYCLKCSGNWPLSPEEGAVAMHITVAEFEETMKLLFQKRFTTKRGDIRKWHQYQYLSDVSTPRVRNFRSRHETFPKRPETVSETLQPKPSFPPPYISPPLSPTDSETETDSEKETFLSQYSVRTKDIAEALCAVLKRSLPAMEEGKARSVLDGAKELERYFGQGDAVAAVKALVTKYRLTHVQHPWNLATVLLERLRKDGFAPAPPPPDKAAVAAEYEKRVAEVARACACTTLAECVHIQDSCAIFDGVRIGGIDYQCPKRSTLRKDR